MACGVRGRASLAKYTVVISLAATTVRRTGTARSVVSHHDHLLFQRLTARPIGHRERPRPGRRPGRR